MKICERFVSSRSEYYVYSPSHTAKNLFFYILYAGYYYYEAGYQLQRDSYDSILLMYIPCGKMIVELDGEVYQASDDSFILIDCYRPHAYSSPTGSECLWIHFDGPTARMWYQVVVSHLGNVFTMAKSHSTVGRLEEVLKIFRRKDPVREPLISQYINDILTNFLLYAPMKNELSSRPDTVEKSLSYINDHFTENISVEQLAASAGLSQYHFIRIFKAETGEPPHKYLVNVRLNAAKYLLKNSNLPIKDICYQVGFSDESVFCSAFKKKIGITPIQYRNSNSEKSV